MSEATAAAVESAAEIVDQSPKIIMIALVVLFFGGALFKLIMDKKHGRGGYAPGKNKKNKF